MWCMHVFGYMSSCKLTMSKEVNILQFGIVEIRLLGGTQTRYAGTLPECFLKSQVSEEICVPSWTILCGSGLWCWSAAAVLSLRPGMDVKTHVGSRKEPGGFSRFLWRFRQYPVSLSICLHICDPFHGMYLFVGWTRMYVLSWTNGGRRFWVFSWKPPEFQVEGQGKNSQLVDLSHWAQSFRSGTKLSWDNEVFRMCLGCF